MFESKLKCPKCNNRLREYQFSNIIYCTGSCICFNCALQMQDDSIRELCNDKYRLENENRRLKQDLVDRFGCHYHYVNNPLPKVPSSYYAESRDGQYITIIDDITSYPNIDRNEIIAVYFNLHESCKNLSPSGLYSYNFVLALARLDKPIVLWYRNKSDRDAIFKLVQSFFLKHLLKDR